MLREARQHAGLSQRSLAQQAGVSPATVGAVEAGSGRCGIDVFGRLLDACGLSLALAPAEDIGELSVEQAEHLDASLSQRLYLAVGGTAHVTQGPWPAGWFELIDVAAAPALLNDEAARSVWLPGRSRPVSTASQALGEPLAGLVRVPVIGRTSVWVRAPLSLSWRTPDPAERRALQTISRVLLGAGRDDGGRRRPAHRQPDEVVETRNLMRALTYAMHTNRDLPNPLDGRAWRLEAPVSLRQWLLENRLPPRRGSARVS